jgi:hypothetical protein
VSSAQDIGNHHSIRFFAWDPDRILNPQYDGIPPEPHAGLIIDHPHSKTGEMCSGAITFDTATMRKVTPDRAFWTVESWDPLTIFPSILCNCGDHGFIRNGRWERV